MKMKRLSIFIIIIIFIASSSYAGYWNDPLKIMNITNYRKDRAKKEIKPVIDALGTGLNSGIFAPVSGKILSFGIQANIVIPNLYNKEELLKEAPVIPFPFVYAGVRIPGFGINLFARGGIFPFFKGKTMWIVGVGGGLERKFIPLLSTKLIIQYHRMENFPYINATSWGGTIIASFTKIPLITPFAFIGLNNTEIKISDEIKIEDKIYDETNFQVGGGIKLFKVVTLEVNFLPMISSSVSLGFSF